MGKKVAQVPDFQLPCPCLYVVCVLHLFTTLVFSAAQRQAESEEAEEKTEFSQSEIEEMKKQILEGDKKQQQFREQV